MSIEQNLSKFNIESFKSNFNSFLEVYFSIFDLLPHVDSTERIKSLEKEIEEKLSQLISLSVVSFMSINNKKELMHVISSSFDEFKDKYNDDIDIEAVKCDFYENLILELLKTQK